MRYAKFISALLAALGVVASSGLLDGQAQTVVNVVIAAVGAGLVYLVPNADRSVTKLDTPPDEH